jgi:hypothetical protein
VFFEKLYRSFSTKFEITHTGPKVKADPIPFVDRVAGGAAALEAVLPGVQSEGRDRGVAREGLAPLPAGQPPPDHDGSDNASPTIPLARGVTAVTKRRARIIERIVGFDRPSWDVGERYQGFLGECLTDLCTSRRRRADEHPSRERGRHHGGMEVEERASLCEE